MTLNIVVFSLFIFIVNIFPIAAFSQDISEDNPYLIQGINDFKAENYEEAIAVLIKAREKTPDSSRAAYYLGITYKEVQDYKNAAIHLKDAVVLKPVIKEAFLDLAEVHYQLGQNEDSLKEVISAEKQKVKPAQTALLKGMILTKLNRNKEAINAFNKARGLDPYMSQAVIYQIGVAIMKEGGEIDELTQTFKDVIIMDPNSDLAQMANQYIEALSRRNKGEQPIKLSLNTSYQYDDNVVLKPSDQTASSGITGEHDSIYVAALRTEYAPKTSGPLGIKAQYSLYYNDHQKLGSYDVMSHTLAIVPAYKMRESMLNMLLSYNYTWVDDDEYLRTGTISPMYTLTSKSENIGQLSVRYQKKEFLKPPFNINEDRDSQDYAALLAYFYFFSKNTGFVNIKYEINKEDTDGINWAYMGNKGNLNIAIPLNNDVKFNLSGETYYQQFDYANTTFLKKRKDITYTISSEISYEFLKNCEIQLQYTYIRDDSNIAVYDYHKSISSIGIEIRY